MRRATGFPAASFRATDRDARHGGQNRLVRMHPGSWRGASEQATSTTDSAPDHRKGHSRMTPAEEFTEFAAVAWPRLRRTAHLLCGNWEDAQDLTQVTLAKVFAAWRRISRHGAAHAYATRTLTNTFIAYRRAKLVGEWLTDSPPEPAAEPAATPELRIVVLGALAALPPRARAVVVLRYREDLSVDQVADLLGCSPGNVKSRRTCRARRGLDLRVSAWSSDSATELISGRSGRCRSTKSLSLFPKSVCSWQAHAREGCSWDMLP